MSEGLIYAFLLDGDGGARRLPDDAIDRWQPEQGLLWLHFDYSHPASQQWLNQRAGLDPLVAAALVSEEARPRSASVGDSLLLTLRGVNLNPGADPEDMVAIRLWSDGNRIISTRRRRLLSVDDLVAALEHGRGARSAADFICSLVARLTDRMRDAIEGAEDQVAELEETVLGGDRTVLRSELATLRRQMIGLRRYIAPQREALNRLQGEQMSWFGERERLRIREMADRLVLYIDVLDSVRERAAVTQEELSNQLSEEFNRRMYVLSVVAAVFLPLSFVTGLLGINVGGMPGVESGAAFWICVGLLALLGAAEFWFFRRRRWL